MLILATNRSSAIVTTRLHQTFALHKDYAHQALVIERPFAHKKLRVNETDCVVRETDSTP